MNSLLVLLGLVAVASATTYFKETFDGDWESRWVVSDWKQDSGDAGKFEVTAGDWYGDAEADKGLRTTQDARFYAISSKIDPEFSNEGKDLVIQFSVKHAQDIDCGGGYLKIFPANLVQSDMNGDSEYNIMFGPDICGMSTKKVHVIFNYKGENLLTKENIKCETDQLTHVYTLIVRPDNTYEVRVDGTKQAGGDLADHWDFLEPKEIKDPEQSKPSDWVDDVMIDDPEDVKPEGYDDILEKIPDPEAAKPDDWDDEDDGEWESPLIDNPDYKGPWSPKRIDNPDYKGPWEHPMIPNPDYEEDPNLYRYTSFGYVGVDVWQVKSGTIFDNIILTDSVEEAEAFMEETFSKNKDAEKQMFDDVQDAKKAEEEAEAAARAEAEGDEDDEEYDDEDYTHDEL